MTAIDTTGDIPDALIYVKRKYSTAMYVDVNPTTEAGVPDLIYDGDAILAAIRNLLMCPIGGRGRIFNPLFGSLLYELLQEPFDVKTASQIDKTTRQAILNWEPRVDLIYSKVTPNPAMPGYEVTVQVRILATDKIVTGTFDVPITGGG